jgi:hypothetical protein
MISDLSTVEKSLDSLEYSTQHSFHSLPATYDPRFAFDNSQELVLGSSQVFESEATSHLSYLAPTYQCLRGTCQDTFWTENELQ